MESKFKATITSSLILSFAATPVTLENQTDKSLADLFPLLAGAEILPQQQEQLIQLHQETRCEIDKILTYTQKSQFDAAFSENENFGKAVCAMNLDSEQWQQLRTIFQSSCTKLANLLTPQQEKQIWQNVESLCQQNRSDSLNMKATIEMLTRLFEIEIA
jgi:hypothetical protein